MYVLPAIKRDLQNRCFRSILDPRYHFFPLLLLLRVPIDTFDVELLVLRLVETLAFPSSTFVLDLPLAPFGGTCFSSSLGAFVGLELSMTDDLVLV
jgi:hypothetical protein